MLAKEHQQGKSTEHWPMQTMFGSEVSSYSISIIIMMLSPPSPE